MGAKSNIPTIGQREGINLPIDKNEFIRELFYEKILGTQKDKALKPEEQKAFNVFEYNYKHYKEPEITSRLLHNGELVATTNQKIKDKPALQSYSKEAIENAGIKVEEMFEAPIIPEQEKYEIIEEERPYEKIIAGGDRGIGANAKYRPKFDPIYTPAAECRSIAFLGKSPEYKTRYNLTEDDYHEDHNKILFRKIAQLNTPVDDFMAFSEYLEKHNLYDFTENDIQKYLQCLNNFKDTATEADILIWFEDLKKHSLLRELNKSGIDVHAFWDDKEVDPTKYGKIRRNFDLPLKEIMDHFQDKLNAAFEKMPRTDGSEIKQDVDLQELIAAENRYTQYSSGLLTTVTGGIKAGHLNVFSAGTGTGKSRLSIANMCYAGCGEYFKDGWHRNNNSLKVVYLSTEMRNADVMMIALAYISSVPQDKISQWNDLTQDEQQRLLKAKQLLKTTNITWEYVPNYTIEQIISIIRSYAQKGYTYFILDYIATNANMLSEAERRMRDDQVLLQLSTDLKATAQRYNVAIDAYTQLNGMGTNDESSIRGSRSIADKADVAITISRSDYTLNADVSGNLSYHLYKNRNGKYSTCNVICNVDFGTMRMQDAYCTDNSGMVIDVPITYTVEI